MNYVWVHVWPVIDAELEQLTALRRQIAPLTVGAGIEEVVAQGRIVTPDRDRGPGRRAVLLPAGLGGAVLGREPAHRAAQAAGRLRPEGAARASPRHGLPVRAAVDGRRHRRHRSSSTTSTTPVCWCRSTGRLGLNKAGIVVGVVTTPTDLHPDGITRVSLSGDPTKALGAVAEAECSRIIAALDLAERMQVPVEWFALSAGARISMDSGTENMDWVARGLKRIIEFTQDGGEINIVVAGINVGAQPYWNAEATMLMHTKGILVMTPDSAMVLTGKQSLDFSGGVSAEDNFGIGGYDRVMGPNGQAQYWAPDLASRPRRPDGALRAQLRRARRERTAAGRSTRPGRPGRHQRTRTTWPTATSRPSATSSPRPPTRTARRPSTSAR